MKRILLSLFLLLPLFSFVSVYAQNTATIFVNTDTKGKLFIDGQLKGVIGVEEVKEFKLSKGEHMIKLVSVTDASVKDEKMITVDPGEGTKYVSFSLKGKTAEMPFTAPATKTKTTKLKDGTVTNVAIEDYIYSGTIKNGLPEGSGVQKYADGTTYTGDFKAGKRWGKGTWVDAAGDKVISDWVNDVVEGSGVKYFANGDRYEGAFKNNNRNGYGVYYWKNGDRYEGNWENGNQNGQGTKYWTTGDKYVGNFKEDIRSGYGIYYWANGNRYEGNWANGEPNGNGTKYWPEGDKYVGNFKDGDFSGYGVYYWAAGDRYEGNWENSLKSGEGTYYFASGDRYVGSSLNDKRNGYGVYTAGEGKDITNCPRCKVYKGNYVDDKKSGTGTCYDASGNVIYSGSFENNMPTGYYPGR